MQNEQEVKPDDENEAEVADGGGGVYDDRPAFFEDEIRVPLDFPVPFEDVPLPNIVDFGYTVGNINPQFENILSLNNDMIIDNGSSGGIEVTTSPPVISDIVTSLNAPLTSNGAPYVPLGSDAMPSGTAVAVSFDWKKYLAWGLLVLALIVVAYSLLTNNNKNKKY